MACQDMLWRSSIVLAIVSIRFSTLLLPSAVCGVHRVMDWRHIYMLYLVDGPLDRALRKTGYEPTLADFEEFHHLHPCKPCICLCFDIPGPKNVFRSK